MESNYIYQLDRIEKALRRIEGDLYVLTQLVRIQGANEMAVLDALQAQVEAQTTVEQSAVTLIQGLAAQIAAAGTDPAKLAALTQQLKTSADALAAAVSANTPAAP